MRLVVGILLTAMAFSGFACEVPPREQYTSPDELISRTKTIALAKVIKAEVAADGFEVLYTFETIKPLKGKATDRFQILGYPGVWEGENRRFNDHSDESFWSKPGGRVANMPDCKIHPTFSVGGTYLVFLEPPYHVKSFEIIIRTHGGTDIRDKWLQYVERRIGP